MKCGSGIGREGRGGPAPGTSNRRAAPQTAPLSVLLPRMRRSWRWPNTQRERKGKNLPPEGTPSRPDGAHRRGRRRAGAGADGADGRAAGPGGGPAGQGAPDSRRGEGPGVPSRPHRGQARGGAWGGGHVPKKRPPPFRFPFPSASISAPRPNPLLPEGASAPTLTAGRSAGRRRRSGG